jgi:hypothetical protein
MRFGFLARWFIPMFSRIRGTIDSCGVTMGTQTLFSPKTISTIIKAFRAALTARPSERGVQNMGIPVAEIEFPVAEFRQYLLIKRTIILATFSFCTRRPERQPGFCLPLFVPADIRAHTRASPG